MTILDERHRISRKEHRCDFCGFVIEKGIKYHWQKLVDGGVLYECKAHTSCRSLAEKMDMFREADDCGESGVDMDFFRESVSEEYCLRVREEDRVWSFSEQLQVVKMEYDLY